MSRSNSPENSSSSSDEQPERTELRALEKELHGERWNVSKWDKMKPSQEANELKEMFFKNRKETVKKQDSEGQNIFHILAQMKIRRKKAEELKALVFWTAEIDRNRMCETGNNAMTGFHLAIQNKNYRMLKHMLDAYKHFQVDGGGGLDKMLQKPNPNNNNNTLVHLAIEKMTPYSSEDKTIPAILDMLVEEASEKTLCTRNILRLTPLHMAVEGRRCNTQQIGFVKKLLSRCPQVLKRNDETEKSVYLHHQKTFRKYMPEPETPEEDQHIAAKKPMKPIGENHGAAGDIHRSHRESTERASLNSDNLESWNGGVKPTEQATKESAKEIARLLKHECLRSSDYKHAMYFLYGDSKNKWKEIYFSLSGKKGEIDLQDFERGYQCANLDDTLQHVHIPDIVIKSEHGPKDDGHNPRPLNPSGREDLSNVFSWLQKNAKVKKIFKLIVDDLHPPSHKDEIIERFVKPFDVEIWDWRKMDICCETIAEAAKNAREVKLYWSGKNAVLRGWSDAEGGLTRLRHLKKVTVSQHSDVEGSKRNLQNFSSFQNRLQRSFQKKEMHVKVELRSPSSRSELNFPSLKEDREKNNEAFQTDPWLECIDDFKNFINKSRPQSVWQYEPIKIAVIDDGIDSTTEKLLDSVKKGHFFCDEGSSSPFVSSDGNGTLMARLIVRIFSGAEILSAKLERYPQSKGKPQFSIGSAAEAIDWAKELGVSIINMSWSIDPKGAKPENIKALDVAIENAAREGILMFCSNDDQGKTSSGSLPTRQKGVFKIGAATAMGTACKYVSESEVDFLFPGYVAENEHDKNMTGYFLPGSKQKSVEGSSIATAFASGLAGLFLHMLKVTSLHERVPGTQDNVKKMFTHIATSDNFVNAREVFSGVNDKAKVSGADKQKRYLMLEDICKKLTSKISE